MLKPGLYEQIINHQIDTELNALEERQRAIRPLDEAEAPKRLADYLRNVILQGMKMIEDSSETPFSAQIELTNRIIALVEDATHQPQFAEQAVNSPTNELLAILGKEDQRLILGKKAEDIVRPESPISQSSIFTGGAIKEPQLVTELKKEIATADRIDFLVSFIKWSGLRKIIDELKDFTKSGKCLRVIATTYTGATEVKAIEELRQLPNTEVKISYETKTTRLHAKAYIFHRDNGFSVAYVGSSNLTHPAISSGLEWNFKVTRMDLPETMAKIDASFESYWSSSDFTIYTEEDQERLRDALNEQKCFGPINQQKFFYDLKPFAYQQEILDQIEAEREIRGNYRNLVVAATGTGKTMISAFDYQNFRKKHPKERNRLLFVAHREEILKQSLDTFQQVLKDYNFGNLFVGQYHPDSLAYLFVSIQTLNSQELWNRLPADYYDYIIVDEFHHAAAESYQKLLNFFKPKILLGLTATPERMDGRDILGFFNNRIAAEIRLPEAIDRKLLSPFQYFGITDTVNLSDLRWTRGGYDRGELEKAYIEKESVFKKRLDCILQSLDYYVSDINNVKGLGFCVSKAHAQRMSDAFNQCAIPSICLTADTRDEERNLAKQRLVSGEIRFIFVVDLYNEGVDIPEVNTVLFLRPTESLTIFLQQLGRGLRLAEGKDCLTVLDFIGQANNSYNFEDKFKAIVSENSQNIGNQIQNGFPYVPKGCYIQLEKVAKEIILRNIQQHFRGKASLIQRISNFSNDSGLPLTLENFLDYYHLDVKKIYSNYSFSRLCVEAQVQNDYQEPGEDVITSGLSRLCTIDSRRWIDFLTESLIPAIKNGIDCPNFSNNEARMIQMFYITIFNKAIKAGDDDEVSANWKRLKDSPTMLDEVRELLIYKKNHIDFIDEAVLADSPLDLHCTYSRNQILMGLNYTKPVREGVLWIKERNTDVLFITLNKSLKEYSPSTLYQDYSVNEHLFHWQSQSTTTPESPTGRRYINHQNLKTKVLLFVREFKNDPNGGTGAYTFLGKANYVSHEGSQPMNILWELERPIPVRFLKKTNKALN